MTRSRSGLLGVCAVLLGLMVASAPTARAESGAQWLLAKTGAGGKQESVTFLPAEVSLSADTTGVLHAKVFGVAVLIECPTATAVNVNLLQNGSVGKESNKKGEPIGAKIKFSSCKTRLNGGLATECEPNFGNIETTAGHGLIVLHELVSGIRHPLVQFLPDNIINGKGEEVKSETLATIEMGSGCPIGSKLTVIGKVIIQNFIASGLSSLAYSHLLEVSSLLAEAWVVSKTPEHIASLLGSALSSLPGAHLNYLFAGDPH
jgi:hypothetical protein